ncbi:MAG: DNA polymerase I, partial [Desulfonatronovibrionaceae bacterium]
MTLLKEKLSLPNDPVFLIDGSSFLYRAFYAFPDLKRSDGFPTNAIYIVLRILLKLIREEQPRYAAFFMDGKGPTFRSQIYTDYKAGRLAMPEDLSVQIEPLLEAVKYLGFAVFVSSQEEADDLIAGQSQKLKEHNPVIIVASDKDLKQLLDEQVFLWDPGGKKEVLISMDDFRRKTGMTPSQWPDYQALVGDSSDNIPGVPGVGPKTAAAMLKKYPDLEHIRDNFAHLSAGERKKLKDHLENIFIYRQLTRLRLDCQKDVRLKDLEMAATDSDALADFLKRYEFRTLLGYIQARGSRKNAGLKSMISGKQPVLEINRGMPDFQGVKAAGLVKWDQGYLLGVNEQEWLMGEDAKLMQPRLAGIRKYVFSLKELAACDASWLEQGSGEFFDIALAAYLLNTEAREYDFEHIFRAYSQEVDVARENKALAALKIGRLLEARLEGAGLDSLMQHLEMPLIPVLMKMEAAGIGIDLQAFSEFLKVVRERLAGLTARIYHLAGEKFNIRSTQQTAGILFERLGLKPRRKTPGGAYSTSSTVLESMRKDHPIIDLILEYRTFEKLRSTYLEPLPGKVAADGRLHTTFNQLATATGRLSSSDPNLQNIPIKGEFGPRTRACFVPDKGNLLVSADYSQIELRVLAHMSEEPDLLEAFARGEDIHRRTAGLLFDRDMDNITPDERRKAKTINFGLLYGMGPQKLSRELSISLDQAKQFISRYFSKFQNIRRFYSSVEEIASRQGYVTTIAGRRRLLPDINSRNDNLAQQAKRMAINTVV